MPTEALRRTSRCTPIVISVLVALFLGRTAATPPSAAPQNWFDSTSIGNTVLLAVRDSSGLRPFGTGFLVYNYTKPDHPILVTCAHLLSNRREIWVCITADSALVGLAKRLRQDSVRIGDAWWELRGSLLLQRVRLARDTTFVRHPDTLVDVAVFPISVGNVLYSGGESLNLARVFVYPQSLVRKQDFCGLGDEVYFVGFPCALGAESGGLTPVVRSGSIAWCRNDKPVFLLDAFSFGGNSGSPVYLKWTARMAGPFLIGMVTGHISDEPSTNVGLATCVWSDEILPVVKSAEMLGAMK